jgi:hypothetical protein
MNHTEKATIGGMDLSNLSEDQLEVIQLLADAAEDGFDHQHEYYKHASAFNDYKEISRLAKKRAIMCLVLRDRLGQEIKNREVA